jgi:hypothetical protein
MHGLLFREEISKHVVSLTTTTTFTKSELPKNTRKKGIMHKNWKEREQRREWRNKSTRLLYRCWQYWEQPSSLIVLDKWWSRSKAQLQTGKIIRFEKDNKQMKVNDGTCLWSYNNKACENRGTLGNWRKCVTQNTSCGFFHHQLWELSQKHKINLWCRWELQLWKAKNSRELS